MPEFNGSYFDRPECFNLNRNQRKDRLREIMIESMRLLNQLPLTKPDLQRLVRIRKKTFNKLLAALVAEGLILKLGGGVRLDPHKFILAEKFRSKNAVA